MQIESSLENEPKIGVALAHYHTKLGPLYIGDCSDLSLLSEQIQRNILQDSLASKTEDLALFILNKFDQPCMIRIQRIQAKNQQARGNLLRYAIMLIIPMKVHAFGIDLKEIARQVQKKLESDMELTNLNSVGRTNQNITNLIHSIRTHLNEKFFNKPQSIEEEYLALKNLLFGKSS
ncbi:hypothetical protein [Candidatus Lokiarchaeum ossiferum]|uniref:hypothetical protein n=1 Tax=Candidatus Lokiarchaeum ossiferum TaxID=2951803 RepID=UPI00352F2D82